jgi:hypothetical protein
MKALLNDPASLLATKQDGMPITLVFAPPEVIINPTFKFTPKRTFTP